MLGRLRKHAAVSRGLHKLVLEKNAVIGKYIGKPLGRLAARGTAAALANPGTSLTLGLAGAAGVGRAAQISSSMHPEVLRRNLGMG